MAYLSKDEYERRDRSAQMGRMRELRKAMENGMTQEQAECLNDLCGWRHAMHCEAADEISNGGSSHGEEYSRELDDSYEDDECCIRQRVFDLFGEYPFERREFRMLEEWELCLDDEEKEKYEDYQEFATEIKGGNEQLVGEINGEIEEFLGRIDERYGTILRPTGEHRIL